MSFLQISLVFLLGFILPSALAITGKTPEASSTALKMHQLYLNQPPHDSSLYETLQVSPNATTAQIAQSYRRLSRKYHPDKQVKSSSTNEDAAQGLKQVRQAYEILKDDSTRLPYHRYGFTDPKVALLLLIGPASQQSQLELQDHQSSMHSLLELTGLDFPSSSLPMASSSPGSAIEQRKKLHEWRVRTMASRLVEQLRPWVEETVEPGILAHVISQACDEWKVLPLGAQIVRCVGRAYRHAGQDYLQQQKKGKLSGGQLEPYLFGSLGSKGSRSQEKILPVSKVPVGLRQQWRKAKGFWSAAWATGRASVTEQVWTVQEKQRRKKRNTKSNVHSLEYTSLGDGANFLDPDFLVESENDADLADEQDMKEAQRLKAQQTLLQSLQVEALWKVTKIDLDRAVQEACNLILEGHHSFFPSYQAPLSSHPFGYDDRPSPDGWISPSSGKAINAEEAKIRAAHAMRYIGNIMVQRSKEGTSWKA
ncbi:unnamed protein product [Cylindrotheca closterium]|uniref:J domain-containing protein n=1 Tax=Cylindrotheca closterium TaxID=2856 RepID=A0AAD2PUH4_9STRA|nr:unnamed protein product [Cylindrotheca closterium]